MDFLRQHHIRAVVGTLCLGLLSAPVSAQVAVGEVAEIRRAENPVEYRAAVKRAAAAHMAALGLIIRGDAPVGADASSHARALGEIARLGGALYPYPPGFEPPQEDAAAFDQFNAPAADGGARAALTAELDRWVQASESLELLLLDGEAGFGRLSRSWQELAGRCQSCHDRYSVDPR